MNFSWDRNRTHLLVVNTPESTLSWAPPCPTWHLPSAIYNTGNMATPGRRNTEKSGQETQRDGNEILALYQVVRESQIPKKARSSLQPPEEMFWTSK